MAGGELDGADDAGLFDQVANSLLTGQRFGGGAAVGRKLGARVAGRVRAVVRIFAARRDDGQDQIGQRRPLRRNTPMDGVAEDGGGGDQTRRQGFFHRQPPFFAASLAALRARRSEEHTSELQSLMRIPYAVFCLKKKTTL